MGIWMVFALLGIFLALWMTNVPGWVCLVLIPLGRVGFVAV